VTPKKRTKEELVRECEKELAKIRKYGQMGRRLARAGRAWLERAKAAHGIA
jgi:hypothetical protein